MEKLKNELKPDFDRVYSTTCEVWNLLIDLSKLPQLENNTVIKLAINRAIDLLRNDYGADAEMLGCVSVCSMIENIQEKLGIEL